MPKIATLARTAKNSFINTGKSAFVSIACFILGRDYTPGRLKGG
jgi:hypothetical protein